MSFCNDIPTKQRAIILAGGGALGAYQVGAIKALTKELVEEDNEEGEKNDLLFDIVAGTSIGAMNGAILVSEFLKTRKWEDAVLKLEKFWADKEMGLGSTPSQKDLNTQGWGNWEKASKENILCIASEETARRYYSVKHFFWKGAPRVQKYKEPIIDTRLFDDSTNKWFIHSSERLEESICNSADLPIATKYLDTNGERQPRFLVFSVDVAEGLTVTFDSYPKFDGSRKSEYGDGIVTYYDEGITIDQVMASGTLPEFYDYRIINGRQFWDGGLLSNTPFRELLKAHQEYWTQAITKGYGVYGTENENVAVPALEVYIVNLHPSKQNRPPTDHDGIKDRQNDILFGDRNSHYDETQTNLLVSLKDFAFQMKNLSAEAISNVSKEPEKISLKEKYNKILATVCSSEDPSNKLRYENLLRDRFKLIKVLRIERTNYVDSIYGKTGDFTSSTINELIKEGEEDAHNAFKTLRSRVSTSIQ
jgi:NTE family protein